jgi:hypothetical protein
MTGHEFVPRSYENVLENMEQAIITELETLNIL